MPTTAAFGKMPRLSLAVTTNGSGRALRLALSLWCVGSAVACSSDPDTPQPADPPSQGTGAADQAGGACNVQPQSMSGLSRSHVSVCSELSYPDDPPAGGTHYSSWAAFGSYSFPVPRGFWVHDLEHGAVVYSYNCDDGCADEVARVQGLIDALPHDPACPAAPARRVLLTPDPLLDVRWGVSAWGATLRADCVDTERFRQFYLNHFALAPENSCNPGIDFAGTPPCQ